MQHRARLLATTLELTQRFFILTTLLGSNQACLPAFLEFFFSLFLRSFADVGTSPMLFPFSFELVKTMKSATDYHSELFRKVNPAPEC